LRNEPKTEPHRNKFVATAGGTGRAAIKFAIFRVQRCLPSRQILLQLYKWTTHVTLSTHIKNTLFFTSENPTANNK
jgi:aspartate/tyrosine/aromatic aminotransferase